MKVRLIRLGSIITLINGIYALLYGLLIMIFSNVFLSEYFKKIPVSWSIFTKSFPLRANLYFYLLLTNAFFLISLGIFTIYLSYLVLKKRDKLAWAILFFSGITSWASLFVINFIVGSWFIVSLSFIGWASFIVGMIIPIKYYLKKEIPDF